MNVGDRVRVVALPPSLPDGMGTRDLFQRCQNNVFPIVGFQGRLIQIEVGEILGEPPYMHSIWIEPEFIEVVEVSG
jgi:hypothetical protein